MWLEVWNNFITTWKMVFVTSLPFVPHVIFWLVFGPVLILSGIFLAFGLNDDTGVKIRDVLIAIVAFLISMSFIISYLVVFGG